jgi:TonB family protein
MKHANISILSQAQSRFRRTALVVAASLFVAVLLPQNSYSFASEYEIKQVEIRTSAESDDTKEDFSLTPLMRAARDGESKIFKSILKHETNINAKDSYGWTALFYAVSRKDLDMVKALVERGADTSAVDNTGTTLLMLAAMRKDTKIFKYLLEGGADVNATRNNGATVLTILKNSGNKKLIELVQAAGGVGPEPSPAHMDETQSEVNTKPVLMNNPGPSYTEEARDNKVTGVVIAQVWIGVDGIVKKVRVLSGLPDGLTKQAMIAAYKMVFKPATRDGQPAEYWQSIQIEFNLK